MELNLEKSALPISYGKIVLRDMVREDVDEMARWPFHLDPFYSRGALMPGDQPGRNRWWRTYNNEPHSLLLAAQSHANRLIGRVSVTLVDEAGREGVMGIRVRPEYEDKGFGSDLLRAFLIYWFVAKRMEVLSFDANDFNKKAMACYRKVGVPIVGRHWEYTPHYIGQRGVHPSGYVKFHDYRITKEQFFRLADMGKIELDY